MTANVVSTIVPIKLNVFVAARKDGTVFQVVAENKKQAGIMVHNEDGLSRFPEIYLRGEAEDTQNYMIKKLSKKDGNKYIKLLRKQAGIVNKVQEVKENDDVEIIK